MNIEELFSDRPVAAKSLIMAGLRTVDAANAKSDDELLDLWGIGKTAVHAIRNAARSLQSTEGRRIFPPAAPREPESISEQCVPSPRSALAKEILLALVPNRGSTSPKILVQQAFEAVDEFARLLQDGE